MIEKKNILVSALFVFMFYGANAVDVHQKNQAPPIDTSRGYSIMFPLFFEKNIGQYDEGTKYYFHTPGMNIYFHDKSITYQLYYKEKNTAGISEDAQQTDRVQNINMLFLNSSPTSAIVGSDTASCTTNRFIGNDPTLWNSSIPNFNKIYYNELYKGVDLKFYALKNRVKYDLIVHPEGHVEEVKLKYSGVDKLDLSTEGKLLINTVRDIITEDIPEAYQMINGVKSIISVRYVLLDSLTIGFEILSPYNPEFDLIIDPVLIYSTFIGGSSDDSNYLGDMVKDSQGNIYSCGQSTSVNYPTTPGAYDVTLNGSSDCVIYKLNSSGTSLIYSTYVGGSGFDHYVSIEIDQLTNEVYLVGTTESANFPTTPGAYQTTYAGGAYDVIVAKLNSNGNALIYSTFVGGSINDQGTDMKIDSLGCAYVTGQTSGGFDITPGVYQTAYGGNVWDAFAFKLNPTGSSLIFSTYLGGTGANRGGGIAIDQNLNIYLHGMTDSGFPTTPGAAQTAYGGGSNDSFVAKLNPSGTSLIYSTYLGGGGDDYERAPMEVDNSGQAYVTGLCQGGFPTTAGAFDNTYNGGSYDVYVTKVNKTGTALMFSTYLGGTGTDIGFNLAVTPTREVYITGQCSLGFPTTPCAYDSTYNGSSSDAFLSILDSTGTQLLYSTFIGGSGAENGNALVAEGDTVYLVGNTGSANFPITPGSYDVSYNGGSNDIFALKIYLGLDTVAVDFTATAIACQGEIVNFYDNSSGLTSHFWSFGDGYTSTLTNPTHTYNTPGTYIITMTGSGYCSSGTHSDTILINSFPAYSISNNTSLCIGDSAQISITGTGSYLWSTTDTTASISVSPLISTNYFVTITNSGCIILDTVIVTVFPIPIIDLGPDMVGCDAFLLDAGPGFSSYLWQDGSNSQTYNCTTTGTYSVTVTNAGGCSEADTAIITILPTLPAIDLGPDTIFCFGGSIVLDAGSGYDSYLWQNNSTFQTMTALSSGIYSVTVNMAGYCPTADSIIITVLPFISNVDLGGDTSICAGETILLDPGSGYDSYLWQNGSTNQVYSVSTSGMYHVTISDTGYCPVSDTVIITFLAFAAPTDLGGDVSFCSGNFVLLDAGPGYDSYLWQNGDTTQTIITGTSGTYSVTVTNGDQCSDADTVIILAHDIPSINLGPDGTLCDPTEISLDAGTWPGATYVWQDGSDLQTFLVTSEGYYYVIVTDSCGSSSDTVYFANCPDCNVNLPNAFSPNGDGNNDIYRVLGGGFSSMLFMIFNRHGEKMFETTDPLLGWDGYYKGALQENEVYFYYLETVCLNGKKFIKKGDVTLLN